MNTIYDKFNNYVNNRGINPCNITLNEFTMNEAVEGITIMFRDESANHKPKILGMNVMINEDISNNTIILY